MSTVANYGVPRGEAFSPLVLIRVFEDTKSEGSTAALIGYVFEFDHSMAKENPPRQAYWKLPAEHPEVGETPLDTAIRCVRGETGLRVVREQLTHIGSYLVPNRSHYKCLFTADISQSELKMMHPFDPENEGEEAKFFTIQEFLVLVQSGEFLPPHYKDMVMYDLLSILGGGKTHG